MLFISLVRANTRGSLGQVDDFRRVNVALTRGRRGVILVGYSPLLPRGHHSGLALLHQKARKAGLICSAQVSRGNKAHRVALSTLCAPGMHQRDRLGPLHEPERPLVRARTQPRRVLVRRH